MLVAVWSRSLIMARDYLWGDNSILLYNAATLSFNYFDFGFVRRGLGGSIVYILSQNRLYGTVVFHILSSLAVSALAGWIVANLAGPPIRRLVFAIAIVAMMARWSLEPGRPDVAAAALVAGAAISFRSGRPILASVCVALGLYIHEVAFLFGLPLLLGMFWGERDNRDCRLRSAPIVLAVLGAALTAYFLLGWLPSVDRVTMAQRVRSHFTPHEHVDWAIYFAVSGARGVHTSICQNLNDPTYLMHLLSGVGVIAMFLSALSSSRLPPWPSVIVACVAPYCFLSIVANDLARWTVLGSFAVWLLCASVPRPKPGEWQGRALPRLATVLFLIPLTYPAKSWRIDDPVFAPMPILDRLVQETGGPKTPRFATALSRCDEAWLSVLGGAGP